MALELGDGIVLNEITGTFIVDPDKCQNNAFVWDVPGHGKFAFYGYSYPTVRDDKSLAEFVRASQKMSDGLHLGSRPTLVTRGITVKFPYDYADAEALVVTADDAKIFEFKPSYENSFPKPNAMTVLRNMVTSFTVLPTQIKKDALYWRDAPDIAPDALEISATPAADINDSIFNVYMLIDEPNGFYAEPEPSKLTYILEFLAAKIIDCYYNINRRHHGVFSNAAGVGNSNPMFSSAPQAASPKYDPPDLELYQEIDVVANLPEQYGYFLNTSRIWDGVQKYWGHITRNAWALSPMDYPITIDGVFSYLDKLISNAKTVYGRNGQCVVDIALLMVFRECMDDFMANVRPRGRRPDLTFDFDPWEFQEYWLYFMLVYSSMFCATNTINNVSLLDDLFFVSPVINPVSPAVDAQTVGIPLYEQIVLTPQHGQHGFSSTMDVKHDVYASLNNLIEILHDPKTHISTMDPAGKPDYESIKSKLEKWAAKSDDPACPPEVLVFTNLLSHDDWPADISPVAFLGLFQPYEELQFRNAAIGAKDKHETNEEGQDIAIPAERFKLRDSMPLLVYSLAFEKLYGLKRAQKKDCRFWSPDKFKEYFNEVKQLHGGTPS